MREIKFRARWKDTGKIIPDFNTEYVIDACNDDMFIVEQFTGLLDKQGKEIYEGDIIKGKSTENNEEYIGIVEFNETGYWVFYKILPTGTKASVSFYAIENIEIIGNKYEDPELLKEVKNVSE